jgi:hypothetical protein
MNNTPLTEREIALVEELGIYRQVIEINRWIMAALCVRCGGDVKLEHDELEYTRKSYELTEDLSHSDYTRSVRLRVRLK